jgi:predicted transglutaminase-like cysteine proteinase
VSASQAPVGRLSQRLDRRAFFKKVIMKLNVFQSIAIWIIFVVACYFIFGLTGCSAKPVLVEDGYIVPAPQSYKEMIKREMKEAKKVNDQVNGAMHFRHDTDKNGKANDHWQSHAETVLAGKTFKDDCDGAAWTKLRILEASGIVPADKIRFALVGSLYGTNIDHAVLIVTIGNIDYILDNRFTGWLDRVDQTAYKFYQTMRLSEEGTWRTTRIIGQN